MAERMEERKEERMEEGKEERMEERMEEWKKKKVMRGHNIVVDDWAGGIQPPSAPHAPPKLTYASSHADGWTEWPTDEQSLVELHVGNKKVIMKEWMNERKKER